VERNMKTWKTLIAGGWGPVKVEQEGGSADD